MESYQCSRIWFSSKEGGEDLFIFAYHESTNYYKNMCKVPAEQIIYSSGIFAVNLPIKDEELDKWRSSISQNDFEDIVYISDEF